jgi:hypothetical protein
VTSLLLRVLENYEEESAARTTTTAYQLRANRGTERPLSELVSFVDDG